MSYDLTEAINDLDLLAKKDAQRDIRDYEASERAKEREKATDAKNRLKAENDLYVSEVIRLIDPKVLSDYHRLFGKDPKIKMWLNQPDFSKTPMHSGLMPHLSPIEKIAKSIENYLFKACSTKRADLKKISKDGFDGLIEEFSVIEDLDKAREEFLSNAIAKNSSKFSPDGNFFVTYYEENKGWDAAEGGGYYTEGIYPKFSKGFITEKEAQDFFATFIDGEEVVNRLETPYWFASFSDDSFVQIEDKDSRCIDYDFGHGWDW